MTITLDKEYRTRDGRDVELKFVDGRGPFPVVGYVGGRLRTWQARGLYSSNSTHPLDLIEARPSAEEVVRDAILEFGASLAPVIVIRIVSRLREAGYLEGEGDE